MSAKKLFLAVALVAGLIAGPAAAHEAVRVAPPVSFAFQVPGASVYYGAAPYVVPAPIYVARPHYGHWQRNHHPRRDHHAYHNRHFGGPYHRTAWR